MSDAPFQSRFTHFAFPTTACRLPFAVGGATQVKPGSEVESRNSQDALSIIVEPDVISGVVCDGCTATHPALEVGSNSSNEVGAKLLSWWASRTAITLASLLEREGEEAFASSLTAQVLKGLGKVYGLPTGAKVKRIFGFDFLMATSLGFLITKERYVVYNYGDGVGAINGVPSVLEDAAGMYPANELVLTPSKRGKGRFQIIGGGRSDDLQSVFVGTDGMVPFWREHGSAMKSFVDAPPAPERVRNGLDYLLPEFRRRIVWNADTQVQLEDDATFALARRMGERST